MGFPPAALIASTISWDFAGGTTVVLVAVKHPHRDVLDERGAFGVAGPADRGDRRESLGFHRRQSPRAVPAHAQAGEIDAALIHAVLRFDLIEQGRQRSVSLSHQEFSGHCGETSMNGNCLPPSTIAGGPRYATLEASLPLSPAPCKNSTAGQCLLLSLP